MPSFFAQVFSCCLRSHDRTSGDPNEYTPINPPVNEVPPPRSYVVDHQKLKDRLGTIVRSKEGKMVNVNAPLPFNLYNRDLDQGVSAHTTPPRAGASGSQSRRTSDSPSRMHVANILTNRLPSYSPPRDPSPSIQTSRSTSSLHPGDASYLPPEEDPDNGVLRPVLNARLVRGASGYRINSGPSGRKRQGRSATRGRLGRFGEPAGIEKRNGDDAVVDVFTPKDKQLAGADGEDVASSGDTGIASEGHVAFTVQSPEDSPSPDDDGGSAPEVSTPHASHFKIQDVGKISQSWGD